MKIESIKYLRCPQSRQPLDVRIHSKDGGEIRDGELVSADGKHSYPIREYIPRFVSAGNYADSFGIQWNRFRSTQLDSVSGTEISRERFFRYSQWTPNELAGKRVLDVGCGAGRFAEIALEAGAHVVAIDYSSAVDACRVNLERFEKLEIIQADIYSLPFEPEQFDYVYCFGVLQHTPNVERAFRALPRQLKPGGKLAVDVYPWLIRNAAWSKYWLRPITKRLDPKALFRITERATPTMLKVSRTVSRLPIFGRFLKYAVPVASYEGVYPLSESQLREWALLDTFDMLSPAHDHPQRRSTLLRWLSEADLENYEVERVGFLVGRGSKPLRKGDASHTQAAHGLTGTEA